MDKGTIQEIRGACESVINARGKWWNYNDEIALFSLLQPFKQYVFMVQYNARSTGIRIKTGCNPIHIILPVQQSYEWNRLLIRDELAKIPRHFGYYDVICRDRNGRAFEVKNFDHYTAMMEPWLGNTIATSHDGQVYVIEWAGTVIGSIKGGTRHKIYPLFKEKGA